MSVSIASIDRQTGGKVQEWEPGGDNYDVSGNASATDAGGLEAGVGASVSESHDDVT